MTTAAPPAPVRIDNTVRQIHAMKSELHAAADAILLAKAAGIDGESFDRHNVIEYFDEAELSVLGMLFPAPYEVGRPQVGADRERIRWELGRCMAVVSWQRRAGTTADRQSARQRLAAAEAAAADERAGIAPLQEQIANLEAKVAELQSAVNAAQHGVDDQELAVQRLREQLPAHLSETITIRRRHAMKEFSAPITALEERIRLARGVIDHKTDTVEAKEHAALVARGTRDDLLVGVNPQSPRGLQTIDVAGWKRWQDELAAELPALEAQLAEQLAARERAVADVSALENFYAR
jgi:flagellar biosynthesis chaperone FliJ